MLKVLSWVIAKTFAKHVFTKERKVRSLTDTAIVLTTNYANKRLAGGVASSTLSTSLFGLREKHGCSLQKEAISRGNCSEFDSSSDPYTGRIDILIAVPYFGG